MMILIDGDACNVIETTEQIAKSRQIPCHIYCDTHRIMESDYSEIHIVDCQRDSADFAIINKCNCNDIVITNDSGLAAMVLAKQGIAINSRGFIYSKKNIMSYLTTRHIRSHESKRTNRNQVRGVYADNNKTHSYKSTLKYIINKLERTTVNEK